MTSIEKAQCKEAARYAGWKPEWCDVAGAKRIFGLSKTRLYALMAARQIVSVCIMEPGQQRGRRYFDADSIREYFRRHLPTEASK